MTAEVYTIEAAEPCECCGRNRLLVRPEIRAILGLAEWHPKLCRPCYAKFTAQPPISACLDEWMQARRSNHCRLIEAGVAAG